MVSSIGPPISAAVRNQIFAIQKQSKQLEVAQLRLASGKKVNSALDDSLAFFASQSLSNRAGDISRLLAGVGQSIQKIKVAQFGIEAIEKQLEITKTLAEERVVSLQTSGAADVIGLPLQDQILAENPVAYWRLDDIAGTNAVNLGTLGAAVDGTYQNGVSLGNAPIYADGEVSANFNGANQYIRIPDSNQINTTTVATRTIEATFRADTTAGRMVIYEEGAQINSLGMYIDDGQIYFNAADAGDWGPFSISAPIEAGETYQASMVIDNPNGEFRAYLNGTLVGTGTVTKPLANHSGNIGIGAANQGLWFHDGATSSTGFYFKGNISEVAIYNTVLNDDTIQSHSDAVNPPDLLAFDSEFNKSLDQIDFLVSDSSYRGTNLLEGDAIEVNFNDERTSSLKVAGEKLDSTSLGVDDLDFSTLEGAKLGVRSIQSAIERVRNYSESLSSKMNVVQIREDYMGDIIDTLEEGSDKLTVANLNEEGANMLALQVQRGMQFLTLARNGPSILDIL